MIKTNLRPGQTVVITRAPQTKEDFKHNFKPGEVVEFIRPLHLFGIDFFEFTNGKIINVVHKEHFKTL
jgi:hypothetical protein